MSRHAPIAGGRGAGMILPATARAARNTADDCARRKLRLAAGLRNGSVRSVVADLPQGSGAHRPHRYPSPSGRRCDTCRTPPIFSCKTTASLYRQSSAHWGPFGPCHFDDRGDLTSYAWAAPTPDIRGNHPCKEDSEFNPRLYAQCWPYRRSPRAVIRWASRGLSAAAPVWAQQPFWMATLPPAPWSGLPATSPTASPSRTAVNNTRRPSGARNIHLEATHADRRGWLLSFSAPALQRGACI